MDSRDARSLRPPRGPCRKPGTFQEYWAKAEGHGAWGAGAVRQGQQLSAGSSGPQQPCLSGRPRWERRAPRHGPPPEMQAPAPRQTRTHGHLSDATSRLCRRVQERGLLHFEYPGGFPTISGQANSACSAQDFWGTHGLKPQTAPRFTSCPGSPGPPALRPAAPRAPGPQSPRPAA